VECRLFLDVVVGQCATILQLLAREDQTLLIRRDAAEDISVTTQWNGCKCRHSPLLILDLGLDVIDSV
jgi:hypothetical protein